MSHEQSRIKYLILNPIGMFVSGSLLGIMSRLLDIHTQNLGNIFSQMAVWILLGTLISIYSNTKQKAMFNILLFCIGMLVTYYTTAAITNGVYHKSYLIGWTIFAICSPVLGYLAWTTKCAGVIPKLIGVGIILVSLFSSIILFDHLRIYDLVIDGILVYYLFFKKINRNDGRNNN